MTTKWEHKGITIELDSMGSFIATVGGEFVRKPSLDAMRKFISDSAKKVFKPFDALTDWYRFTEHLKTGELAEVRVVGIKKIGRARFGRPELTFVIEGKVQSGKIEQIETSKILPVNDEVRRAYKAFDEHVEETRRIDRERSEQRRKLERAFAAHRIDVEKFSAPKAKA